MYTRGWKLTDQEIARINEAGKDIEAAQAQKRQAFIKAGGVILNPTATKPHYFEQIVKKVAELLASMFGGSWEGQMRQARQITQTIEPLIRQDEGARILKEMLPEIVNAVAMVKKELCFGGGWEDAKRRLDRLLSKIKAPKTNPLMVSGIELTGCDAEEEKID